MPVADCPLAAMPMTAVPIHHLGLRDEQGTRGKAAAVPSASGAQVGSPVSGGSLRAAGRCVSPVPEVNWSQPWQGQWLPVLGLPNPAAGQDTGQVETRLCPLQTPPEPRRLLLCPNLHGKAISSPSEPEEGSLSGSTSHRTRRGQSHQAPVGGRRMERDPPGPSEDTATYTPRREAAEETNPGTP